jgi:hypothetical protein
MLVIPVVGTAVVIVPAGAWVKRVGTVIVVAGTGLETAMIIVAGVLVAAVVAVAGLWMYRLGVRRWRLYGLGMRHRRNGRVVAAVVVESWMLVASMVAGLEGALGRSFKNVYGVEDVADTLVEVGFSREYAGGK